MFIGAERSRSPVLVVPNRFTRRTARAQENFNPDRAEFFLNFAQFIELVIDQTTFGRQGGQHDLLDHGAAFLVAELLILECLFDDVETGFPGAEVEALALVRVDNLRVQSART